MNVLNMEQLILPTTLFLPLVIGSYHAGMSLCSVELFIVILHCAALRCCPLQNDTGVGSLVLPPLDLTLISQLPLSPVIVVV